MTSLNSLHLQNALNIRTRFTRASILMLLPMLVYSSTAKPQEVQVYQAPPVLKVKNFLPNAIGLLVTPKGMEIFKTKLKSLILTNADFDPSDVNFDPFEHKSEKPIPWSEYKLSPDSLRTLKEAKKFLAELLIGFSLNEIQPWIYVGSAQLQARFSRFALVTDEDLLRSLGRTSGAVLALEMEIQEASLTSDYIKVFDLNNKIFKKPFGLENLEVNIAGKKSKPLKIRIPFYVSITPEATLHFEAIRVESNLATVEMDPAYSKILSPSISLIVDDQRYEVNANKIESLVRASHPAIIGKLKNFIADFAQTELPRILNEKAQQSMVKKLEEVQPLSAPGSTNKRDRFFYGLQLGQINQNKALTINMNAYVEDDPEYSHEKPHLKDRSRGAPNLSIVNPETYDFGVSIDRGFINRLLQLSFERRFFEKIPLSDGVTLKLTAAPLIDSLAVTPAPPTGANVNPKETLLKLQISLQVPHGVVKGLQKLAIKDNFEMSVEAVAKLKEMPYPTCGEIPGEKGINILLSHVNLDSIVIEDKWLTSIGRFFRRRVVNSVKDALGEIANAWGPEGQSIGGCFIPPKEVIGLKLDVARLGMDPNGHLLLYFNYAKPEKMGPRTAGRN